jgi:hypothetical protein
VSRSLLTRASPAVSPKAPVLSYSSTSKGFIGLSTRQNGNKRKQRAKEAKMNTKILVFFSLLLSMSLLSCGTPSESSKAVPPDAKIVELSIPICD